MTVPLRFSTLSHEPSLRARAWREMMSEVYFRLDVQAAGNDPIRGKLVKRMVGALGYSRLAVSSSRVTRTKTSAAADKVDAFCFVFPLTGTFVHRQRGKEVSSSVGEVYALNASEPYEVDHVGDASMICLTVPCDLVRLRVRDIDDRIVRPLSFDPVIAEAFKEMIIGTVSKGATYEARNESLCLHMLDMMLTPASGNRVRRDVGGGSSS